MSWIPAERNRPIASVIRDYINKKSGKVTASRTEIKRRFFGLDWKDQKKILLAFLNSSATDRNWAYSKLLAYWDPSFEAKVLELWETYHEPKCNWAIIRHFPEEFLKEHISELNNERDYYFICRRLIEDKEFVVDKEYLSTKDYLLIMMLKGENIDDDEALNMLYGLVEKIASFREEDLFSDNRYHDQDELLFPKINHDFIKRNEMMHAYDIIGIGTAIGFLSRMNKKDVINKFYSWENEVRKAASESEEFKALKNKSLNDYNYNCAVYDIFRKYLLINLPGRCIKSEPPVLEPQEPEYITVDYGQCPF